MTDAPTQEAAPEAAAPAPEAPAQAAPEAAAPAAQEQVAAVEPFTLTAPEGAEAYQGDFDKFAGDMDQWLTANPNASAREALQEAAARQARVAGEGGAAFAAAEAEHNARIAAWEADARKLPELAGENFGKGVADFKASVTALGGDDLVQHLNESGLANHPGIVRAFLMAGKATGTTPFVNGQAGTSTRRSFADALYGNG